MIKNLIKFVSICAVTSLSILCLSNLPALTQQKPLIANKQVNLSAQLMPVLLPKQANIYLKEGQSMSARLTNIDSQAKKMTISLSGESRTVSNQDVDRIVFEGDVTLRQNKTIVITPRGENDPITAPQIQLKEPLTNVKIIDATRGKAEIQLTSLDEKILKGIIDVLQTNDYVIQEIKFESPELINIIAKPY